MFEFDSEFVSQGQVVFKNESDSDSDIEEGEGNFAFFGKINLV